MNDLLYTLSEALNLATPLTAVDLVAIILIFILLGITFLNVFSQDKTEVKPQQGLEKKSEVELKVVPTDESLVEDPGPVTVAPTKPTVAWDKRLFKGLSKTRSEIWGKVAGLLGTKKLDDDVVEEIEEILFTSDLSPF